ncbi:hypothetical protein scyTo_0007351 [Scyliorhinus torazame]|uniref:Uncharacterized protein n=1 Tax=Scyliorhinus torazame TaxID=75743 RepID=A0A401NQN1_SCYTO|nr:hypothetical protein [Scyliorhinus torazame]
MGRGSSPTGWIGAQRSSGKLFGSDPTHKLYSGFIYHCVRKFQTEPAGYPDSSIRGNFKQQGVDTERILASFSSRLKHSRCALKRFRHKLLDTIQKWIPKSWQEIKHILSSSLPAKK